VDKDGPADIAGFGKGDAILAVGNTPVRSVREFDEALKGLESGSIVWIRGDFGGKVEVVKVTVEKKK
jgi:S1-C subfamily serine protease